MELFRQMQSQEASIPDGFTFPLLLNACKVVLGFERLKMASKPMNRRFVESGCGADVFCGGGRVGIAWLTCMFSKRGSMRKMPAGCSTRWPSSGSCG